MQVTQFGEQRAHGGTGLHTQLNQVAAGEQGRDEMRAVIKMLLLLAHEIIEVKPTVRTEAVETVKLQFQEECRAHQHAAKGRFAHVRRVLELHVMEHGGHDVVGLLAREFEALKNFLRHLRPDFFVGIKVNGAIGGGGGGLGLGDVVEQDGPRQ